MLFFCPFLSPSAMRKTFSAGRFFFDVCRRDAGKWLFPRPFSLLKRKRTKAKKNEAKKRIEKEPRSLKQMRAREGDGVPPTLEECQAYAATTGQSPRSSAAHPRAQKWVNSRLEKCCRGARFVIIVCTRSKKTSFFDRARSSNTVHRSKIQACATCQESQLPIWTARSRACRGSSRSPPPRQKAAPDVG